jgi:uncharacterized protein
MITYVDTSTLIKLIIEEPGSDAAASLWDQSEVVASARILLVEARAALASARRAGRLTPSQHRSAIEALSELWAQISVVDVSETLVAAAAELAERHGLRGYDAVHLAAAQTVGADILTSADRALCEAASREGFHVANPLDAATTPASLATKGVAVGVSVGASAVSPGYAYSASDLRQHMTMDSGVFGIPVPATATPKADGVGQFMVDGIGTIQEFTAYYKDYMSTDGWIFDAEYSALEPYQSEDRHLGYITNSIYVKPTDPITTVAIIVGNADGLPGHKRHVTIIIMPTSDDDLPTTATRVS